VTLARQRAAAGGISNARFLVTDAQQMDLGEAPFDTAVSQFGVMFFDETVTAFASIRSHVRPGGRLTFICWQALADNPWYTGPALAPFCPPAAAPAPGKNATGPFTLADPEYTAGILTAAGWSAVERTTYRRTVSLEREVLADEDSYLRYLGVTEDRLAAARAASDRQLAPLLGRDGRYDAPLAFQVFTART
jgi:SAM-dependent methyltransferase